MSLWRWLPAAAVLHAASIGVAWWLGRAPWSPHAQAAEARRAASPETWIDVVSETDEAHELPRARSPEPPGAAAAPAAPGAALLARVERHRSAPARRHANVARSGEDGTEATSAGASGPGPGSSEAGSDEADGAPGTAGAGPRLSLRDLGVGGANPFLDPASRPTERQTYNQRLRESLRGDLARADQRRGLGPEGPAVAAVRQLVMDSATAPNNGALLRLRTDGAGRVTLVEVVEAERDVDEWRRVANRLVQALAGKSLRVPRRSGGVTLDLRVSSRVTLPSGADPGLEVELFGQTIKQGDGDRSTKISVLSPTIVQVPVPGTHGVGVPIGVFSLIAVAGDPVDIGAVARRVVTAYLVAMDTHEPSPAVPTAPAVTAAPSPATPAPEAP